MKIFLDANILVSVLNKEYPSYIYFARIMSMAYYKNYPLVTTTVCLAIAFYFAEKKHREVMAKRKLEALLQNIDIADCGKKEAFLAMQNKKIHDFEDGLQYYAALHDNCTCIVSNDQNDFYFSSLPVYNAEQFYRKYI